MELSSSSPSSSLGSPEIFLDLPLLVSPAKSVSFRSVFLLFIFQACYVLLDDWDRTHYRVRIWFSPNCSPPQLLFFFELGLFWELSIWNSNYLLLLIYPGGRVTHLGWFSIVIVNWFDSCYDYSDEWGFFGNTTLHSNQVLNYGYWCKVLRFKSTFGFFCFST